MLVPAVFSAVMRLKKLKKFKHLLFGEDPQCSTITTGGCNTKLNLVCGYIYRLADASSLHRFVQFVFFLQENGKCPVFI